MDKLINDILLAMNSDLTPEQLQKLSNVLAITLHGKQIVEEQTALAVNEWGWQKVLRLWIAAKRLENCSEGTLDNYRRTISMMMLSINKLLPEITTNDLRYYLAMYQEQRKIGLSYLDTLRRYINSFFGWCQDEGYINRNPARRLTRVKVPKKIKQPYTAKEREVLRCHAQRERDLAIMEVL